MKSISRSLVVLILSLVICISFVSMGAEAKSKTDKKVYKSSKVTITIVNDTVTVKGKGAMPKVKALKNNTSIKKVVIKSGITSIPDNAFSGCKNLTSVKLPKTLKIIGTKAFYKTSIKSITIPNSVKTLGEMAFNTRTVMAEIKLLGSISIKRIEGYETESGYSPVYLTTVRAKKITFTNSLKDINLLLYFDNKATEFVVSSKDKNYASANGIIYSKDYKKVVRIPNKKVIKIKEGCEEFDLNALYYGQYLDDGGATYGESSYKLMNTKARKLILPKSITKITDSEPYRNEVTYKQPLEKIIIQGELDADNMKLLNDEIDDHKEDGQVVEILSY